MPVGRATLFRLATSTRFERTVRAVAPAERHAWRAASRYVAGITLADAWQVANWLHAKGIDASVDQFGELVTDAATAERVAADYVRLAVGLAQQPDGVWLSIDLSHLGLDVDRGRCADHFRAIADALPPGRRIQVGAEDHDRADAILDCVLAVAGDRNGLADRIGATVQANLHRSGDDLDHLVAAGVHVRLVKGAYVEPPERALPYGEPTDIAYLRLAHRLAQAGANFSLATHDGVLREALLAALGRRPVEQLLGVRPETLEDLVAGGVPVRVYVPYGAEWFRYWMRRVAESRGA
ncbi:MAG: proline dehydrogenase family protein [Geodermatophilaceae bacterium]|nr:proline dehydrogenase family protein [Geodermatophilaceae bacterium]